MVERIRNLCTERRTSIKALEKELGFGNGTIRRWDDNAPSFDRISLVANYFNVPVTFITDGILPLSYITGENENKKSPAPEGAGLTPDQIKAIEKIKNMPPEELARKMAALEAVLDM